MEIIKQKENKLIFKKEMEESLANALRRYLNEIPIVAIDELEISKNDTPLYDETIAHRIGLIPLKMDKKFNPKTELKIKLKSKKEGLVYSEEIKGDVEIVFDKIPLTFLNKNQEIEISGIARVGKGNEHTKFSPGILFYRNSIDIKIDKECPKEIVDECPKGIFELKDNKIIVKNVVECDMCDMCVDFCTNLKKDYIKINPTKELIITLESFGQMKIKDILNKTIEVLKKDLEEVGKKLK
ncbi:MAG: DNA-directed RNA polymerase subunit D [Nanoarchaeota archaeon]